MIRAASLALLAVSAAYPASALSCLVPSPIVATQAAMQSDETFHIVRGALAFEPVPLPGGGTDPAPEGVSVQATVEGQALTGAGFTTDIAVDVTIEVGCAGPWCGGIAPMEDVLLFLKRGADGLVLEVGACPQWVFEAPTGAQLDAVLACVTGGTCAQD